MNRPRIALIHATPIAIDPIKAAFASSWPEAEPVNILEDSLSPDRAKVADITDALTDRIVALTQYARMIGSDAVLFTCSAFGRAIEQAARTVDIPVLKPNEAMFEQAIRRGGRTAMLYTFPPAREGMEEEFREEAARIDPSASIQSILVGGAIEAVRAGDVETHNRLVAEAASKLGDVDAITLAHFSTARALASVKAVTSRPVLSSPDTAIVKLRGLLGAE
ncbi:aspartate/glutamate racemase family protein [Rhizobium leguminosarum]|uniref:aspartate/glutamate racemase family protein n=1 Tax=Rhizobium leguminosarum TaxID=384 RepID=UPI0013BF7EDF|nr:aspartate/glutamate racemase family protein [Rhizobium leguminosarum]NEI03041.1 arylsulfatase [Rhizobium leguminosarum]NEJ47459.1 arylsulfatase [Rhizobium leguminosarum]NEJ54408.1 arylsulfatase [Rhizobium leguminosarum]NEJ82521.1 arylsulfatase [Rhizobium leguminosarum]